MTAVRSSEARVALITGAGSDRGIGFAAARALAEAGSGSQQRPTASRSVRRSSAISGTRW